MDDLEAENMAWERKHNPLLRPKPEKKSEPKQQKEPKPDYDAMSYNELKHLVSVRGLKAKGRKKADLLAALEA